MSAQQNTAPPLLIGPPPPGWPASWISHPSARLNPNGVYLFRRSFALPTSPKSLCVRVSADNRYELYVNGTLVRRGPARGDLNHWRYDTVEIAPLLREGKNVIAAVVWWLDYDLAPWAQMGHKPGFVLCGEDGDKIAADLHTPNGWKCARNDAHTLVPIDHREVYGYTVVGPGERIDAADYPWGWQTPDFDDSHWDAPAKSENASPRGMRDGPSLWMLTPNLLPAMEETPEWLTHVVRTEGLGSSPNRLTAEHPITIPSHTKATLLFDRGHLTTGYPELEIEGGKGGSAKMRYAEALVGGPNHDRKGNRNEIEGRVLRGYTDEFFPDQEPGGIRRFFRPLWWRTFRYLEVVVETNEFPLTLHGLKNVFTAYPFEEKGRFSGSDESLASIWEVGWRTARLCAHETYMDCPYYEQLQYGGDTRIQCLVSYYVGGDGRLARNAISQLDDSRLPEGITQSRYPSHQTQVIPPFALWWIGMIHDYWMFQPDPEFVRNMLPGMRGTLQWFLERLDVAGHGLLGPLPWWNFVDWSHEFRNGVPDGAEEGGGSIVSLQLVLALRETAEIEESLGRAENARYYRDRAKKLSSNIRRACWDSKRGLLADTPKKARFSQHANALAILADTISGDEARKVGEKLIAEPGDRLVRATFYFRFYVHRALRKAGLGDRYLEWLQPWRDMLAMGLTTWAENPEPTRSDCHAWSAHPNADLLAIVLGVEPSAPGFSRVRIAPHMGSLEWVQGVVPHPSGGIEVKLRRGSGTMHADITLPPNTEGSFVLRGREHDLHAGPQSLVL